MSGTTGTTGTTGSKSSGGGSGDGGGTGTATDTNTAGRVMQSAAVDTIVQHLSSLPQPTLAQIGDAAAEINAMPAPADPVTVLLQALHMRLTAIETALNLGASVVQPDNSALHNRLRQVEDVAEQAMTFVEAAAPLLTRVKHAFDTHFGGKV